MALRAFARSKICLLLRRRAAFQPRVGSNKRVSKCIAKFFYRLIAGLLRIFESLAEHLRQFGRQKIETDDLWAAPRHHLVDGCGEAPQITAGVHFARIPPLLRRHEVGRAQDGACHRLFVLAGRGLGQAEVREFRDAVLREQDVRRLDVAVDDAEIVCLRETVAELAGHGDCIFERHRPIAAAVEQTAAVHKLHDQKRPVFRLAVVVDLDDVRVINRGD